MFWNNFDNNRHELCTQYDNLWQKEETLLEYEMLKENALKYAETLKGDAHPIIKAKVFDYILTNASLYINPKDWFGLALNATKINNRFDVGYTFDHILVSLRKIWEQELDSEMYKGNTREYLKYSSNNNMFAEMYTDYNHSTPCWQDILSLGIKGVKERAKKYENAIRESKVMTKEQEEYYKGIEITYEAILKLFDRYIVKLESMLDLDGCIQYMYNALLNLRNNAPRNIYEALLLGWLFWYIQENIDCIRVRTMGGIDQLYYEFFKNDIKNGTYTRDQIKELLVYFMNEFNAFHVHYQQPMYFGGMDKDEKSLVNDLSYLAFEAYNQLSAPNPKLQVKINRNTPVDFLKVVLDTIRKGNSSISIINDEIAAASLIKIGIPVDEARTSLMSGCWDYTVKDHETKTIPIRLSLPKVLELTLNNGVCSATGYRLGIETGEISSFKDFETFYCAFIKQFDWVVSYSMQIIENWERYLRELNPSNMYSATMMDSLQTGRDAYAYGMKYNTTVYSIAGLASVVDSLMAIKRFVFEKKEISFEGLLNALKNNWEGYEAIRIKIIHDTAKYGNGHEETDQFTAKLAKYCAVKINRKPNSRGGFWKIGLLSIDKNVRYGKASGASPDGRLAGEPFSKNLSPVIGMDRGGITTLINSVTRIDFTDFPHAGMFDIILHPSAVSGEEGLMAFCGIIKTFFAKGGHSIQCNVFDSSILREAQEKPDDYRNLQIRVCGWNVYFVDLEKVLQDAFIRQAEHAEGLN